MAEGMRIAWHQWLPFRRWRILGQVDAADEVPERLPRNGAVIVGSEALPKWLIFDCACRSGHRVMLNLDLNRNPRWHLVATKPLSVTPSIDYAGSQRRCHYYVRNGRTAWAKDSYHG